MISGSCLSARRESGRTGERTSKWGAVETLQKTLYIKQIPQAFWWTIVQHTSDKLVGYQWSMQKQVHRKMPISTVCFLNETFSETLRTVLVV